MCQIHLANRMNGVKSRREESDSPPPPLYLRVTFLGFCLVGLPLLLLFLLLLLFVLLILLLTVGNTSYSIRKHCRDLSPQKRRNKETEK